MINYIKLFFIGIYEGIAEAKKAKAKMLLRGYK